MDCRPKKKKKKKKIVIKKVRTGRELIKMKLNYILSTQTKTVTCYSTDTSFRQGEDARNCLNYSQVC